MLTELKIGDFLHRKKVPVKILPDEEYSLVTVKLYHKGVILREKKKGSLLGSDMYRVSAGDFILSGIDARNGAFGIVPEELEGAIVTNDFWYFDVDESKVKRDFFYWLTTTPLFLDACQKSSKGETQRIRLQKNLFNEFIFHFPPIEEQDSFLQSFGSIDKSLSSLKMETFNQSSCLTKLRQAILQEAIEGKLTADWRKEQEKSLAKDAENAKVSLGELRALREKDPNYSAEALLEKIQAEKEKLIKEGKIKKQKPLPPIKAENVPFDLPDGWVWTRLGEVFSFIDYRGKTPTRTEEGVRLISAKNIKFGHIDNNPVEYIAADKYDKWMVRGFPKNGDILFVTEGHTMGFVARIDLDFKYILAQRTICLQPIFYSYPEVVFNFMMSPIFQSNVKDNATGAAATGIKSAKLKHLLIPLPPLAEQEFINKHVNNHLSVIELLEKQVLERKEQSEQLMQAVLWEAFEGGK